MKRTACILVGAASVWLGITMVLRNRIVVNPDSFTAVVALFTAIPVAYAAVVLILAPRPRLLHAWSVVIKFGLSLLGLALCGIAVLLGWTSDVPRVSVVVTPLLLVGNVIRLAPGIVALFRQIPRARPS